MTETEAALTKVQGQLLPLAEQRRSLAEIRYKEGDADLATLLLAEEDLQSTMAKLIDLQKKRSLATIRMQRVVGGSSAMKSAGVVRPIQ